MWTFSLIFVTPNVASERRRVRRKCVAVLKFKLH